MCAGPLVIWYQRPSECGVWQCTEGNSAFVRGHKLCMVLVAYMWCGILKHHFCCSSPKKRICIGLLIIMGGSQFLALSKNWHQLCNGIYDPSFPSVQCGVAAACHCGHQSAVRYEVSLPGILMRRERELQLQPQPPPVSTGWMHVTQPH